ncbi:MAG: tetratricopeptide repeat protein [Thiohalobacterales bacterium]
MNKHNARSTVTARSSARQKALHIYQQGLESEKQGNLGLAEKKYRKCLSVQPDLAEAHNRLGNVLASRKKWKAAEQSYRRALQQSPGNPVLLSNIGNVLYLQENYKEASAILQQALKADPEHALANNTMGNVMMKLHRLDDAVKYFETARRKMPGAPEITTNLGSALCKQEEYEKAIPLLQETLEKNPRFTDACLELANALYRLHGPGEAIMLLDKALSLMPDNAALHASIAEIFYREGQLIEARKSIDTAIKIKPDEQDSYLVLGKILRKQNRQEESIKVLRDSVALDPQNPKIHCNLGLALESGNHKADAVKAFKKALQLDPGYIQANCRYLRITEHAEHASDLGRIEALLDRNGLRDLDKASLLNALGKSRDDNGDYRKAFEYFREGNDLKSKRNPCDIEAREKQIETIKSVFTEGCMRQHEQAGSRDCSPVFITGMSRSGKSLLESVLGIHPEIITGGESSDFILAANAEPGKLSGSLFPECMKAVAEPPFSAIGKDYADRLLRSYQVVSLVTNTHPANTDYLGMIRLCLPESKILICRREGKDTCTEIYKKNFDNGNYYSLKFDTLSSYYRLQEDLLDYWARLMPDHVHIVQFEELVHEPKKVMNDVLDFCKLPSDKSAIVTNGNDQRLADLLPPPEKVIGVWKRYESQMAPLFDALEKAHRLL